MRRIFTLLVITLMTSPFFAQTQHFNPKHLVTKTKMSGQSFTETSLFSLKTDKSKLSIPKEFKNYSILSLQSSEMKNMLVSKPKAIDLLLPGKKSSMLLELVKVEMFSDEFSIIEMPSGKLLKPENSIAHYRGIVKNSPNSIAAITISDGEISGLISLENEIGNLVLGKLDNGNDHILYEDKDIQHLNEFVCQTKDVSTHQIIGNNTSKQEPSASVTKCPEIFFDIANDIVRDKGGAQAASNYIQAIFNQVALLYNNEDVNIKISGIRAWTSTAPFNNLDNYRSYRNQNGFNGDLGHFVTYNYSGGVAWLNALCGSYRYGLSGINRSYNDVPRYSWTVSVIAHELGHNFGSNHTHSCVWNGNNTAIDGCYTTEGGCGRPGIPSDGGTIMSYCHLTNVGTNLRKGFGSQPGNVIRRTISRASCVSTCEGDGGGGDEVSCAGIEPWSNNVNYVAGDKVTYQGRLFERTANNSWNDLGACSTDPCFEVPQWSDSTNYNPGDLVIYQGNLFRRNNNDGWDSLGSCNSNSDPCFGVNPWSENENYTSGDQVIYQGNLFEWNGSEWVQLASCSSSLASLPGTSIKLEEKPLFKVYPNPSKTHINLNINHLKNGVVTISIRSMQGIDVFSKTTHHVSPIRHLTETIDTQSLTSGIYFVTITNGTTKVTKKITIE
ncbi:M12 family metallo-peptidase [Aquimarina sp. D1M17]|uniref:M12 family metallo-peptidase n=1 Tax=Aquimarina acroporae TaxID=2937283 RepID=UPI0020C09F0B|nr:M12 family metallo-peptidase [Aquimarina acroporae]MCK8523054.1 M12 family metallo-peptidase [Aquimarina acroporae]